MKKVMQLLSLNLLVLMFVASCTGTGQRLGFGGDEGEQKTVTKNAPRWPILRLRGGGMGRGRCNVCGCKDFQPDENDSNKCANIVDWIEREVEVETVTLKDYSGHNITELCEVLIDSKGEYVLSNRWGKGRRYYLSEQHGVLYIDKKKSGMYMEFDFPPDIFPPCITISKMKKRFPVKCGHSIRDHEWEEGKEPKGYSKEKKEKSSSKWKWFCREDDCKCDSFVPYSVENPLSCGECFHLRKDHKRYKDDSDSSDSD